MCRDVPESKSSISDVVETELASTAAAKVEVFGSLTKSKASSLISSSASKTLPSEESDTVSKSGMDLASSFSTEVSERNLLMSKSQLKTLDSVLVAVGE